jgi:SM-20-related protein
MSAVRLADAEVVALGERGVLVREGWLGAEPARAVKAEIDALVVAGRLRPAAVSRGAGHRVDPAVRGDAIAWLDPDMGGRALADLRARFAGLREALSRDAWLGLGRTELQLARYPGDGAGYRRHLDAPPGWAGRRATAIYYANPGWRPEHGGCLRLHLPSGPLDVAPALDRLVVFLSERVEHEVLPTFAPRLAVTAWFHGPGHVPV